MIPSKSQCPKCGDPDGLIYIAQTLADFDCLECGQRMDKRDYIEWAIKNFNHKIDMKKIFEICIGGVNND